MKRLLSELINNFDWFPLIIGGTFGLCLIFVSPIVYKAERKAEKERLNQEIVTFTIRCA